MNKASKPSRFTERWQAEAFGLFRVWGKLKNSSSATTLQLPQLGPEPLWKLAGIRKPVPVRPCVSVLSTFELCCASSGWGSFEVLGAAALRMRTSSYLDRELWWGRWSRDWDIGWSFDVPLDHLMPLLYHVPHLNGWEWRDGGTLMVHAKMNASVRAAQYIGHLCNVHALCFVLRYVAYHAIAFINATHSARISISQYSASVIHQ